jgi:serine/threonine protein kinase/Flp pilus assembly protein TadD
MQYVEGQDLKDFIKQAGTLTVEKAVNIAQQVCAALQAAHDEGVIHRDLKPQNIMVDKKGNAYVMDFGIARSLEAKEMTIPGAIIGTPHYMSPELAEGKKADARSDIYSLGCIMYEMLTAKPPFDAHTTAALIHKHIKEKPQAPSKLNPQIPQSINRLILKCLEKEPKKRYQEAPEIVEDLKEAFIAPEPPAKALKLSKKLAISLAAILIVIIGVVIFLAIRKMRPETPSIIAPAKKSIAVMYFKNNTGDKSLDHWRSALSDLLIADLTQSKYLKVLSAEELFNILGQMNLLEAESYSSEDLKKIASQGKVEHILLGNYAKAGDTIRINIMLQDASTGETIGSELVEGVGEESFFTMVDELTRRIKGDFEFSEEQIAGDIDKNVGQITTSSPEAFKYFSQGWKYMAQGDFRQSIQFMERAMAIDPEFASAYRIMAAMYGNMGYSAEAKKYSQKALELVNRVSERERYQIEGDFYSYSEKTWDKAIEAYKKLLQLYPDDISGNSNLAYMYYVLEQWDKAIEQYAVRIQNKDAYMYPFAMSAGAYGAKGQYDKSIEVLQQYYVNNETDNLHIRRNIAFAYGFQKKYDLALAEADKISSVDPTGLWIAATKGFIYQCKGDLIEAEKEYKKLIRGYKKYPLSRLRGIEMLGTLYILQGRFAESESKLKEGVKIATEQDQKSRESMLHFNLAYLYLKTGNPEEALEECHKMWSSAVEVEDDLLPQKLALYIKGLIYLEMNSMDEAQKTAEELKKLIDQSAIKKHIRYYYHLMGRVELEKGNYSKAINYFKEALSLMPHPYSISPADNFHSLFRESLAFAYYSTGDLDKAREEYEKIISLTTGKLFYGDIYAKSFYMLGKTCQQKGWEGKAIEHYEEFLNLWKDADPGIPEIADAKNQLTILQSK